MTRAAARSGTAPSEPPWPRRIQTPPDRPSPPTISMPSPTSWPADLSTRRRCRWREVGDRPRACVLPNHHHGRSACPAAFSKRGELRLQAPASVPAFSVPVGIGPPAPTRRHRQRALGQRASAAPPRATQRQQRQGREQQCRRCTPPDGERVTGDGPVWGAAGSLLLLRAEVDRRALWIRGLCSDRELRLLLVAEDHRRQVDRELPTSNVVVLGRP